MFKKGVPVFIVFRIDVISAGDKKTDQFNLIIPTVKTTEVGTFSDEKTNDFNKIITSV